MNSKLFAINTGLLCLSWSFLALTRSPAWAGNPENTLMQQDTAACSRMKYTLCGEIPDFSKKLGICVPHSPEKGCSTIAASPSSLDHYQNFSKGEIVGSDSQQLKSHSSNSLRFNGGLLDEELIPQGDSKEAENPECSKSDEQDCTVAQLPQTPPQIPPGTVEPPGSNLEPLPTPQETPIPEPFLQTPEPEPTETPSGEGVRVKIKSIKVLGSTVFSPEKLQEIVQPFIGKEATFEQLLEIRTAITNLYTRDRYTTSGAFLPPQDVTSGEITIQVIEGAIEKVEIQGLNRLRENYVRSRIERASRPPVNLQRLEEALQLLQLNPLLSSVQAELTAGTAPGLSVLTLSLKETPPITTAFLLENRESPSVGEIRGTVAASHNNLLGYGDRFAAEYGLTEGIVSYSLSYDIPVNSLDGTLSLRYGNNSSNIIEEPFAPLNIEGEAQTVSLSFRQPIIRTPSTEFAVAVSADWRQSQTYILGEIPFSFSEGPENGLSTVTALRFSQEWTNRSSNRVFAARSQFSVGVNALNATINEAAADGQFFSWVGQFQYVQALGRNVVLIARTGIQLSNDTLLSLEQFSIGGVDTVRGYRQNQRVADNGFLGSVEVRFPLIREPDGIGIIQIAPFFDIGTVWNNNSEIATPQTLSSVGLGLRWELSPYFLARLDWGIPLTSIDNQGGSLQDSGLHFSFRLQPF
ncbi:ShlB/FhaC/HecB family hemolysin secretion/activation protein [Funiculus sociatus GB2-A5]|uniref:ShlB/FhaC/HecB family hemolysin secretion/activation protein n=1 Tax=Funiculus sociatus GB2-A5 TaxID=2933946 RepID=A0ABV0JJY4_9CYAN|nr:MULTISPECIES: ShlB/FhaC/HecB family hemolysin secretion/activation protein [unclassified Trichocoleus]